MTQTRYQVPRSAMADAERFNMLYLTKNVKLLRATYQIRLLAFRAATEGLKLVLRVPSTCDFHPTLLALIKKTENTILKRGILMGLYLCIFDGDDEVDGVEVGPYAEFGAFRDSVVQQLEGGSAGSTFPTLILHSDCDGEWSPAEARQLEDELTSIGKAFCRLAPIPITSDWKRVVAKNKNIGLRADNLYDCFFDVDGEPLLQRLIGLAKVSQSKKLPILFQ